MPKLHFETVPVEEVAEAGIRGKDRLRPSVLVVDDERIIADTLAAILERQGFRAQPLYDAESALELIRIAPPELLVSDVVLPGMSGIDLAIILKTEFPSCKVLLFSGQANTVDLLAVARRDGHDFTVLVKPIHPSELLAHISDLGTGIQASQIPSYSE